jgi:Flp pilus assembly protein TadG
MVVLILLQRFISDRRGNMAVMFALFILSITMVAGGALDVVTANTAKDRLSDALDAALLAGAGSLSISDDLAKTTAGTYLSRNAAGANNLRYSFNVNDDVLSGEASATSTTVFLGLFGIQEIPIKAEAAATVGAGSGGMELAIVVDVSGSMTGSIPSLRASITDLLGTIYEDEDSLENTWISIIPFSGRVNVTNYGESWFASGQIPATAAFSQVNEWGITSSAASRCKINAYTASAPRLCASRRTGDNQWTNALPSDERFRMFGGAAEVCPVPRAQGLTQSRSTLQQITNNLCAGQGTSTQEGMAWGWRAVSPRWKGLWGDPDLPLDYEDSPGKFVIIMTDGANHPGQSGDTISVSQADAELLKTCDAMKREGIVIYAITYNMGGSLSSLYQRCTSRPEYEISAESFSELTDAFLEIGSRIKREGSLRLIK